MKIKKTILDGCYIIENFNNKDSRGRFIKTFHYGDFAKKFNKVIFKEQYYTSSKKNVIRGIHFQIPPHDHDKLITCISGKIIDLVIDLRSNSKNFGKIFTKTLNEKSFESIFIPSGFGHGFLSLTNSIVLYNTTTVYSPKHDKGVLWSSVNYDWKVKSPILSKRDKKFPVIDNIKNYF